MRVRVHFTLVHQTLLVVVQKLDRVLDRNHVLFAFAVDLVEHRRERCRLARTGWTGHQNQAAWLVTKRFHYRRQSQGVESLDLPGNRTEYGADGAALVEHVAAKTGQVLQAEREVELEIFF